MVYSNEMGSSKKRKEQQFGNRKEEYLPHTCTHWSGNLQVHVHLWRLTPSLVDHRVEPGKGINA